MKRLPTLGLCGLASLSLLVATSAVRGELVNYYVAIDNAPNEPLWSAYNDLDGDGVPENLLPNPNQGRLTLLYAHHIEENPASNHFHTLGRYSYTGELSSPSITDKNEYSFWSGNVLIQGLLGHFIPEQFAEFGETLPPLPLQESSGVYAGKLTSLPGGESGGTYANMEIRPTSDMAPYAPGTPEHYMLHSLEPYGEKYDDPLTGASLAIELLDMTPGLNIGGLSETSLLATAGDTAVIGSGDDNFSFTPVFWTEAGAAPGVYSATMRLVDVRTSGQAFLPSGQYTFSFSVVPEPTTAVLSLLAVGAGFVRRR